MLSLYFLLQYCFIYDLNNIIFFFYIGSSFQNPINSNTVPASPVPWWEALLLHETIKMTDVLMARAWDFVTVKCWILHLSRAHIGIFNSQWRYIVDEPIESLNNIPICEACSPLWRRWKWPFVNLFHLMIDAQTTPQRWCNYISWLPCPILAKAS